ncbi:MAG TPA: hypothetical protein VGN90_17975 [Pyrinomonadaceae bacterium]|jgi:hypothetical protein|nr:hypothetical protein [Pyrinomonadaceae bacterium]
MKAKFFYLIAISVFAIALSGRFAETRVFPKSLLSRGHVEEMGALPSPTPRKRSNSSPTPTPAAAPIATPTPNRGRPGDINDDDIGGTGVQALMGVKIVRSSGDWLRGAFTFNSASSDDPDKTLRLGLRQLPAAERSRFYDSLSLQMSTPSYLLVDRQSDIFNLRTPQGDLSFMPNFGSEQQTADGRKFYVRSTLTDNELFVSAAGEFFQQLSFSVKPLNHGRQLQVTRFISLGSSVKPIVFRTVFDRTTPTAFHKLSEFDNLIADTGSTVGTSVSSGLIATLNDNLSSETSRPNDTFTMSVAGPEAYRGATVQGIISEVSPPKGDSPARISLRLKVTKADGAASVPGVISQIVGADNQVRVQSTTSPTIVSGLGITASKPGVSDLLSKEPNKPLTLARGTQVLIRLVPSP